MPFADVGEISRCVSLHRIERPKDALFAPHEARRAGHAVRRRRVIPDDIRPRAYPVPNADQNATGLACSRGGACGRDASRAGRSRLSTSSPASAKEMEAELVELKR